MAGNPIFTSQKRKFTYTSAESSTSIKPPLKRKKSKENIAGGQADEFDEWDDDLKLTQQELTDIDVAASQAYVQTSNAPSLCQGNNQAPINLPAPSKPAPHPSRGPLQNEPNIYIPKLVRQSSSTSSSSTYPISSSATYESFSSNHSTSSNGPRAPPQLGRTGSTTAAPSVQRFTSGATTNFPSNLMAELEQLREEMKKFATLKEEMYIKEGQITFLQKDLQRREQEVAQLHQEKMQEETRDRSEKEKTLKAEMERLVVELQFKNQEIHRLREKCLETKSSSSTSDTAGSPKVRRLLVERPSSHPTTPQKIKEQKPIPLSSPPKSTNETSVSYKVRRNCSLQVSMPKGALHGSQLMSQLLQNSSNTTESLPLSSSGTNIVPLLHLHTTLDFQGVKFCRDEENFFLFPVAKSGADIQKIVETSDKKKSFVSNVNLNLAMYGISQLLTIENVLSGRQLFDTTAESVSKHSCPSLLLLPLMEEYFTQYSEQLSTQLLDSRSTHSDNGNATSSSAGGSWKTSSVESSLESLGSSLNFLLQVRSDVANNLEQLTLTALRILFKLASFSPGLRWALLTLNTSSDTEKLVCSLICSLAMTSPDKKNASPKTGTSFSGCLSHLNIERLELLSKLFKLANPVPEMLCNPNIVEAALTLLILLAKSAIPEQLERFEPAISRGIICHSLSYNSNITVQMRGLQLLQVLIGCPRIVTCLCTDGELCPLAAMYTMVAKLVKDPTAQTQIYPTVIDILDTINSEQTSGVSIMLNTHCSCNMECVKCCVNLLYDLLENHQSKCVNENTKGTICVESDDLAQCQCMSVLCKGILLLHTLSQRDQHFEYRLQDCVHNYTILVSQLQLMLEQDEDQWKTDTCALKELWEFVLDPDSSMEEDESQAEISMETT